MIFIPYYDDLHTKSAEKSMRITDSINFLGRDFPKLVKIPVKRNYEHMMRIHRKKKGRE